MKPGRNIIKNSDTKTTNNNDDGFNKEELDHLIDSMLKKGDQNINMNPV